MHIFTYLLLLHIIRCLFLPAGTSEINNPFIHKCISVQTSERTLTILIPLVLHGYCTGSIGPSPCPYSRWMLKGRLSLQLLLFLQRLINVISFVLNREKGWNGLKIGLGRVSSGGDDSNLVLIVSKAWRNYWSQYCSLLESSD